MEERVPIETVRILDLIRISTLDGHPDAERGQGEGQKADDEDHLGRVRFKEISERHFYYTSVI